MAEAMARLVALETANGDLRALIAAQDAAATASAAQLERAMAQMDRVMASHEALHQEVRRGVPGTEGGAGRPAFTKKNQLLDNKSIKLPTLGVDYKQEWQGWTTKAKNFIAGTFPDELGVEKVLTQLESQRTEVTKVQLEGLDSLSTDTLRSIGQFLIQALDGSPAQIVSVWRRKPATT